MLDQLTLTHRFALNAFRAAYPAVVIEEVTLAMYDDALKDLQSAQVMDAVMQLVKEMPTPPSIAEIRALVAEWNLSDPTPEAIKYFQRTGRAPDSVDDCEDDLSDSDFRGLFRDLA